MFVIEKNVPLPPHHKHSIYPISDLKPGESFFVPFGSNKLEVRTRVQHAVENFKQRMRYKGELSQYKFSVRSFERGVRVWRTQ